MNMHSKCYTFVSIIVVLGTLCPLTATAEDLQDGTSKEGVTRANDVTGFYQKAAQCKSKEDCKNGGECDAKNNGTFCSCPEGTEGDFCDRVPSCDDLDCGNEAECKYSKDKKAGVCECKQSKLTFVHDGKKCKACRCANGYCEEEKGELVCKCYKGWGLVPTAGLYPYCEKCDCGAEYNCTYRRGGGIFSNIVKKTCLCPVGYEDRRGRCEAQCKSNEDCKNGGECVEKINGTFCSCPEGTEGDSCDRVPSCDDLDCGNEAECKYSKDKKAGVCECKNSTLTFIKDGKKCEECKCKDGYCEEEKGKLVCKCYKGLGVVPKEGFGEIPYCRKCDCGGEYNCTFTIDGGYWNQKLIKKCLCPVGYEDKSGKCKGTCEENPCQNGGNCRVKGDDIECQCKPDSTGDFCEYKEGSPCFKNPCMNGGKCNVVSGKESCTCPDRFTGYFCEKYKCDALKCRNGGTCAVKDGNAVCNCKDGYTGKNCEKDACSSMTCKNGGTCYLIGGKAYCNCTGRYSGKNCETDKCFSLTCENDGTCGVEDGEALCICPDGYTGKICERVDKCWWICGVKRGDRDGEVLCEGGPFGRVTCKCQEENKLFDETQRKCKVMDQCANHVCENGGTCIVYKAIAKCLCRTPFSGDRCEIGRRDENKTLYLFIWVLCSIIALLILIIGCITIIRYCERKQINAC